MSDFSVRVLQFLIPYSKTGLYKFVPLVTFFFVKLEFSFVTEEQHLKKKYYFSFIKKIKTTNIWFCLVGVHSRRASCLYLRSIFTSLTSSNSENKKNKEKGKKRMKIKLQNIFIFLFFSSIHLYTYVFMYNIYSINKNKNKNTRKTEELKKKKNCEIYSCIVVV